MKWRGVLVCLRPSPRYGRRSRRAEHTRYWRQSDSAEFGKGTAKGVAIRSDGKLMPAPEFTESADPNLAYIWQLQLDSRGAPLRGRRPGCEGGSSR